MALAVSLRKSNRVRSDRKISLTSRPVTQVNVNRSQPTDIVTSRAKTVSNWQTFAAVALIYARHRY